MGGIVFNFSNTKYKEKSKLKGLWELRVEEPNSAGKVAMVREDLSGEVS